MARLTSSYGIDIRRSGVRIENVQILSMSGAAGSRRLRRHRSGGGFYASPIDSVLDRPIESIEHQRRVLLLVVADLGHDFTQQTGRLSHDRSERSVEEPALGRPEPLTITLGQALGPVRACYGTRPLTAAAVDDCGQDGLLF